MKIVLLKKVILTCCEAALLMEQENANSLSFKNKIRLKIHLLICKWCKKYHGILNTIDHKIQSKINEQEVEIKDLELDNLKIKINKKLNL